MTRNSEQIRLKYTKDYYLKVCGGTETPAFDANCLLPLRMAQPFSMARLKAHDQVLDLGCGRGELVCEAAKLGCEATGVDYSADAIELARQKAAGALWEKRCKFHQASITQNFPGEGQFDVIFALDVFEHIHREELRHLLTIVKRRLKRGGRFVFHTSPNRHYYSIAYSLRDSVADTSVVENDSNCEFCLRWLITDRPVIVHFRTDPSMMIGNDPRLFGACLERIICERN